MLSEVRRAFPDHPIHIDCNSGYRLADEKKFQQLDEFKLTMIEQPLSYDDLIDHARLQAAIETPICLDESITGLRVTRQAVALGSCRYVNVKPGRVGGLTTAVAIHDHCRKEGIPCWVGGMLESATGSSICAALAMLENFTYPADIFPTERFYREDLAETPLKLESIGGVPHVRAPQSIPEPDPDRLATWTVERATIQ